MLTKFGYWMNSRKLRKTEPYKVVAQEVDKIG
jgi:hypothetical protein